MYISPLKLNNNINIINYHFKYVYNQVYLPRNQDDGTIIQSCIIFLNKNNFNENKIYFHFYYITKETNITWIASWVIKNCEKNVYFNSKYLI